MKRNHYNHIPDKHGFDIHHIYYDQNKPTTDNIYIDIKVGNNSGNRGTIAKFEQTRADQLVANPSNYYLSLVRWKVPGFNLPILIFPIEPNQNDVNRSDYTVTFETSTNIFQYHLYYVSYNSPSNIPINAVPTQEPSDYYFVYDYQQLLNILNHGLQMAHDNVTGKPVGSEPPYMLYDPETKLFSYIAQQSQYGVDIVPNPAPPGNPTDPPTFDADIKVYFNFKLFALFNGLPSRIITENSPDSTQGRDVQILAFSEPDNTYNVNYYIMKQTLSSVAYWSPVKQIIFITEIIPINSENTATSNDSFRKILTDFEPIAASNQDVRTTLQYFPQGQYRLIDLIGTKPQFNIDLTVKWLDINGNEYFVLIPPFQQFSAKIIFVKRNLYKTDNLIYDS